MKMFKKRITNALIRLRVCAGLSAPLLFASSDQKLAREKAFISILAIDEILMAQDMVNRWRLKQFKKIIVNDSIYNDKLLKRGSVPVEQHTFFVFSAALEFITFY